MLTHIVMMKFMEAESAATAQELLCGLVGKVPTLLALEAHLDITRSSRSYDLVLITRHKDPQGLSDYQTHPAHVEVGAWLKGHAEHLAVVDFNAAD